MQGKEKCTFHGIYWAYLAIIRLNIFLLWQRDVSGRLNEVEIVLIHLATILGKQLSCLISILLLSYS